MRGAIDLNNKLLLAAQEIHDKWSDRFLAHEFTTIELPVAQVAP
jgi:hypothetical protein